jgi:hypothetical protein
MGNQCCQGESWQATGGGADSFEKRGVVALIFLLEILALMVKRRPLYGAGLKNFVILGLFRISGFVFGQFCNFVSFYLIKFLPTYFHTV